MTGALARHPGTQAEQQQQGGRVFGPHCRMRCNLDRDQRQLVLIPKQRLGAIRDHQSAFHLDAAGQKKGGATTHPGQAFSWGHNASPIYLR